MLLVMFGLVLGPRFCLLPGLLSDLLFGPLIGPKVRP